ncbi:4Fe-4S binding protein, partial [Candidatus Bathyarchaeota archaeon]
MKVAQETESTVEAKQSSPGFLTRFRGRLRGRKARIYYWPIRTVVQLAFFLLFAGLALTRLVPSFVANRGWIVLPVLASIKAPGAYTGAFDATTLLLSQPIFPWLPIGIFLVVGAVLGRFMCGWICPVGFIQDVVTGIKGRVTQVQRRTQNYWVRLKYVLVFLAFILSGSLSLALYYGSGNEYRTGLGDFAPGLFVAITPEGTLFGTLPAMIAGLAKATNPQSYLSSVPVLTWVNIIILVGFFFAAWQVPRFWCRYVCPVGAIMAVFQKNSLLGMHRDPVKCADCKECQDACPMQVPILDLDWKKFNDSECILC